MAKTLYFTNAVATAHRGNNDAKLNGTASWWIAKALAEARGVDTAGTLTVSVATVAGTTLGVELGSGATAPYEWISEPLSADFTISGTITLNLWAAETAIADNAAINAVVDKIDGATGVITQIAKTARTTELGTAAAAENFTVTPTSTACKHGDRLRVRVFADDAGTMAAPGPVKLWFDRSTAAQGESYVTFTESLTFESAGDPGRPSTFLDQPSFGGLASIGFSTTSQAVSQVFTAGSNPLAEVRIRLTIGAGSPADDVVVEIQTDNAGSPSGTVVAAVGSTPASAVALQARYFAWPCNISLTPAATYHLVVNRSGAISSTAYVNLGIVSSAQPGWSPCKQYNGTTTTWVAKAGPICVRLTFANPSAPVSTYYLTDTAETINPGSAVEKKALASPGPGSVNAVTNTAAGPTAGIQVTDSAGGSALEWYTPPLQAFTLGGKTKFNLRALESNAAANASLKAEIATCANDGTGASVWGIANAEATPAFGAVGEVGSVDNAVAVWVAGDDRAVTAGQRLRFRVFVDDCGEVPLVTGNTVTVSYNGAVTGSGGDSYVILPVAVTEQSGIPDVNMALAVT